jgi:hypothetical protein
MTLRIVRLGTPRADGEGIRVGTVRRRLAWGPETGDGTLDADGARPRDCSRGRVGYLQAGVFMDRRAYLGVLVLALAAGAGASAPAVGQRAPDFILPAASGGTRSLADVAGKKNVVLVFFRGVW